MHGLRESSSETSWLSHTSGVYTVLKSAVVRSEIVLRSWHLADGQQATKPVYCSEDRYTHPFNGPFSGTTGWAGTRKVLLKQETVSVSGSGISWAICKSAPRSRQITMPAPHHSVFFTGRMPFLPPNQQGQSTEGKQWGQVKVNKIK